MAGGNWRVFAPRHRIGAMTFSLHTLLGTELPLVQAPMAGAQGSAMTVAVSNAGALGSLPGALLSPAQLRDEIEAIRAGTGRPYNVNFFCHTAPQADAGELAAWRAALQPFYDELGATTGGPGASRNAFDDAVADLIEPYRPPVVSFHFGLPPPALLARVRGWGAKVLASATTVDEARWLAERGVDAVIAQGLEAGGHRGHFLSDELSRQMGTFTLLPQIVQAVSVPVIAAGGIADAAGVAAARALGAAGVQVGTAYLLCPEATISPMHRAALQEERARHTALTRVFTGRPARGIVNRAMQEIGALPVEPPPFPLAGGATAPLRAAAEARGSGEFSPLWAGQNTAGCREIGAAEMTCRLMVLTSAASRTG